MAALATTTPSMEASGEREDELEVVSQEVDWGSSKLWLLLKEGVHILLDRLLGKDASQLAAKCPLYGRLSRVEKRALVLRYAGALVLRASLRRDLLVDTVSLCVCEACEQEALLECPSALEEQRARRGRSRVRSPFMQKVMGDALEELGGSPSCVNPLRRQVAEEAVVTEAMIELRGRWLGPEVYGFFVDMGEGKPPPVLHSTEVEYSCGIEYFLPAIPSLGATEERQLLEAIKEDEAEAGKETVFAANLKKALRLARQARQDYASSAHGASFALEAASWSTKLGIPESSPFADTVPAWSPYARSTVVGRLRSLRAARRGEPMDPSRRRELETELSKQGSGLEFALGSTKQPDLETLTTLARGMVARGLRRLRQHAHRTLTVASADGPEELDELAPVYPAVADSAPPTASSSSSSSSADSVAGVRRSIRASARLRPRAPKWRLAQEVSAARAEAEAVEWADWWWEQNWSARHLGEDADEIWRSVVERPAEWMSFWAQLPAGERGEIARLSAEEAVDVIDSQPFWLSLRGMVGCNIWRDGAWPIISNDGHLALVRFRRDDRHSFWTLEPSVDPAVLIPSALAWIGTVGGAARTELRALGDAVASEREDDASRGAQSHLEEAIATALLTKIVSAALLRRRELEAGALGAQLILEEELARGEKEKKAKQKRKRKQDRNAEARKKELARLRKEEEKRIKRELEEKRERQRQRRREQEQEEQQQQQKMQEERKSRQEQRRRAESTDQNRRERFSEAKRDPPTSLPSSSTTQTSTNPTTSSTTTIKSTVSSASAAPATPYRQSLHAPAAAPSSTHSSKVDSDSRFPDPGQTFATAKHSNASSSSSSGAAAPVGGGGDKPTRSRRERPSQARQMRAQLHRQAVSQRGHPPLSSGPPQMASISPSTSTSVGYVPPSHAELEAASARTPQVYSTAIASAGASSAFPAPSAATLDPVPAPAPAPAPVPIADTGSDLVPAPAPVPAPVPDTIASVPGTSSLLSSRDGKDGGFGSKESFGGMDASVPAPSSEIPPTWGSDLFDHSTAPVSRAPESMFHDASSGAVAPGSSPMSSTASSLLQGSLFSVLGDASRRAIDAEPTMAGAGSWDLDVNGSASQDAPADEPAVATWVGFGLGDLGVDLGSGKTQGDDSTEKEHPRPPEGGGLAYSLFADDIPE